MLSTLVGAVWRHLPSWLRRRVVRLGQTRFTVAAGAIIVDEEGRVLLLEHVFRPDSGWGLPGGFLSKGEQPDEALRRELREEIALEVAGAELALMRALRQPPQIEIYFRCRALGQPAPQSFEIKRAAWFALGELPRDLSEDQRRLIRRELKSE